MLAPPDKRRSLDLAKTLARLLKLEQAPNIAETLDEEDVLGSDGLCKCKGLKTIGQEVVREYEIDRRSRADWEESTKKAMDIALQVRQPKNYPFQGAANIKYPLVTVAALQFGARAYPAIIDGNRVVKTQVVGRDDGIPMPPIPMMPDALGMMGQGGPPPSPPSMGPPEPAGGMPAMQTGLEPGGPPNSPPGPLPEAGMPPDMQIPQGIPAGPLGMPPGAAMQPPGAGGAPIQWLVPPGAKRAKADRVSKHMSWQLLHQMEEWEEDTDVLLHHLPIVGCAFRKVYWCEELSRNKSEMIPAVHLVVNTRVRSLAEAPRATHEVYLYPQQIEERMLSGTFLEFDIPAPTGMQVDDSGEPVSLDGNDDDAPHLFLEQHRYLDLDEDGYREPYIVTVHKDSCTVVRIVANFRMENVKDDGKRITRIAKDEYFVKYTFLPDPKGGFYDIGFGRLLESLGETIDTSINQMLDAGHLQNAGGGLIGTGIRFKKNRIAVTPGKYEQVELSGKLADNIYAHQFAGPSPVLFQLLGMMIDAARDITAVKDILTGDTGDKGVQTATTTLAQIEQGLKVFTAIYKRVYRSLKQEFELLFELNARYLNQQEYFAVLDEPNAIERSDYDVASMDIMPVADPKMVTDMQRSARANVLMQIAGSPMGVVQNPVEALRRVYDSIGMEEPEKLVVQQQGPSPQEQLTLASLDADVKQKTATAQKLAIDAAKIAKETELLEPTAMHAAHMSENQSRIEAARIDTERESIAAAERGNNAKLEHERMVLAQKEKEAGDNREHSSKSEIRKMKVEKLKLNPGETINDSGDVEGSDHVKKLAETNDKLASKIDTLLERMLTPIEVIRGKDGKIQGAKRILQ